VDTHDFMASLDDRQLATDAGHWAIDGVTGNLGFAELLSSAKLCEDPVSLVFLFAGVPCISIQYCEDFCTPPGE
jgi:hypothetical protein